MITVANTAATAKSVQSCPTLCNSIDGSPPGKNTGVGCQFLLQCMKVKSESEVTQSCPTLSDLMDCSLVMHICNYIFVQTHRMYNAKSEP